MSTGAEVVGMGTGLGMGKGCRKEYNWLKQVVGMGAGCENGYM